MQQMTNHRPLAELDLLDDFLFNALLAYPEYGRRFCRKFLKILFGREFKNADSKATQDLSAYDIGISISYVINFYCPFWTASYSLSLACDTILILA